jgi:hypothetical protein
MKKKKVDKYFPFWTLRYYSLEDAAQGGRKKKI